MGCEALQMVVHAEVALRVFYDEGIAYDGVAGDDGADLSVADGEDGFAFFALCLDVDAAMEVAGACLAEVSG